MSLSPFSFFLAAQVSSRSEVSIVVIHIQFVGICARFWSLFAKAQWQQRSKILSQITDVTQLLTTWSLIFFGGHTGPLKIDQNHFQFQLEGK